MEFQKIKVGTDFKMSKDSLLVYTKKTKKTAKCKQESFSIELSKDQIVIAQDD
jgi:hypothetical protein